MKHWWVPGLQIGYEHTFIHQVADFLEAAGAGQERGAHFPRCARDRRCHGRVLESAAKRNWVSVKARSIAKQEAI